MANDGSGGTGLFVGRERELAQVDAACRAAAQGRGSVLVVAGEPGIGKTSFCEEAVSRAEAAGLRGLRTRCWVDRGAPPLWPWRPILEELGGAAAAKLLGGNDDKSRVDRDRFARFAAVTDHLAKVGAAGAVCLLIDDVHAADPGTLLLTRFVARSRGRLPLVLLLSRRDDEPADDRPETELLRDIESEATLVALPAFDEDEVSRFLVGHGSSWLAGDLVATLRRVTHGNPLFLRRIVASGAPTADGALPAGLRVAIDEALARCTPATLTILRSSAVLGQAPSVTEAAGLTGNEPVAVLDAVAEAASAGLVSADLPDRFSFTHELVRAALEDSLPVRDRLDAHARAARLTPSDARSVPPDRLARRAHHALAAAARSTEDAAEAVDACRAAALALLPSFAYEQADALLAAAVDLHDGQAGLGSPPARLLVEWAEAALQCGRMTEARQRFDRAAVSARREDDPVLFARAVLGLGGLWLNEHRHPLEQARVLGLQRTALETLPADQVGLRCRLAARLAAEAAFQGEPVQAVLDVLDAARASGDVLALAEVLSLTHHTLFTPEHTRNRLPLADELVRVASEAGHGVLGLMGLCWRAVDLFHLGDRAALRALEDLRESAQALACQDIVYIVAVMDVMLLIRAGRLEAAEEAAYRCRELGDAAGEVDSLGYLSAQLMTIRWLQGRDAELLDAAEQLTNSPTLIRAEFSMHASAALMAARSGQPERARARLAALAPDGLAALPPSSSWLSGMAVIVETAALLGDAERARQGYDLLLPHADLPVVASLAVVCLGSTQRPLGLAAAACGELDRAVGHLQQAVDANDLLGNQPLLALTRADLAGVLGRRGAPGDRDHAVQLYGRAVAAAEEMGMSRRAVQWREDTPSFCDLDVAHGCDIQITERPGGKHGLIQQLGSRWLVAYNGRRIRVADLVGMSYLAELLTRPGKSIPVLTLASRMSTRPQPLPHQLLDAAARDAYKGRIGDLSGQLAQAEADNDIGRAAQVRLELDAVVEHLEAATGLTGRPRSFIDDPERARTAVSKAIRRAIAAIDDADPSLARLLRRSVVTGKTCSYSPDPHDHIVWSSPTRQVNRQAPRSGS